MKRPWWARLAVRSARTTLPQWILDRVPEPERRPRVATAYRSPDFPGCCLCGRIFGRATYDGIVMRSAHARDMCVRCAKRWAREQGITVLEPAAVEAGYFPERQLERQVAEILSNYRPPPVRQKRSTVPTYSGCTA